MFDPDFWSGVEERSRDAGLVSFPSLVIELPGLRTRSLVLLLLHQMQSRDANWWQMVPAEVSGDEVIMERTGSEVPTVMRTVSGGDHC